MRELRAWLSRRALAGMEVDDIVQETYAVLAGLERVDHIRNPRTYMFEVAKTVVYRSLRRSRVISLGALAEAVDGLQAPSDAPSPEQTAADRQELGRVAEVPRGLHPAKDQRAVPARGCAASRPVGKHGGETYRQGARNLDRENRTWRKPTGRCI